MGISIFLWSGEVADPFQSSFLSYWRPYAGFKLKFLKRVFLKFWSGKSHGPISIFLHWKPDSHFKLILQRVSLFFNDVCRKGFHFYLYSWLLWWYEYFLQVSLSGFAFLFSELVQYNQTQVDNIAELERRFDNFRIPHWLNYCNV